MKMKVCGPKITFSHEFENGYAVSPYFIHYLIFVESCPSIANHMKLVIKLKIKGCKWKKDLRIKKRKKLKFMG
jgi:hypothetical protein